MVRNGVHVGAGLGEGDAGFEPPDRMGAHVDAAIEERRVVPLADGGIDIALDAVKSKFRRQDTRNGIGRTIQVDGTADDVRRSAEVTMPKAVAEHDDRGGPNAIVLRAEVSTEGGMNAERGEEAGGDHEAVHTFGLSTASEVVVFMAVDS